ncbi:MAG: putative ABC transport system permease protein [Myxococcota bacterium]
MEYLRQRNLTVASGRTPALLGEVVAGAAVAEAFQLSPGDTLRSDLTNLYNLAGAYPTLLTVVGILSTSGTPDDSAFFADIKTGWLLEGRLHGHEELTGETALDPEAEGNLEATAALLLFTELTQENRSRFHVHGDLDTLPISTVLVFPDSIRRHDQLLGDYALRDDLQAVRPAVVIERILGVVLRLQAGLSLYMAVVGLTTVAFLGLVVSLSLRLRRDELALMRRIGCSRWAIPAMIAAELSVVLLAAAVLAVGLTAVALWGLSAVLLP